MRNVTLFPHPMTKKEEIAVGAFFYIAPTIPVIALITVGCIIHLITRNNKTKLVVKTETVDKLETKIATIEHKYDIQ